MQKKLIALAVAGAAAGFTSAPVLAQSQVSVYGVIDVGIESGKYSDAAGNLTRVISGGNTTNRLGFKGSEDLGNGLKANFMLEHQPNPDTGGTASANFWHRTSTVGLSSSSWGSVNLGRQYTPWFSAFASQDIFHTAGVGTNYTLMVGDTRMSNSIRYDSVNINGFNFTAIYGFGETTNNAAGVAVATDGAQEGTTAANKKAGQEVGLKISYANGPFTAHYGYDKQKANTALGAVPDTDITRNQLNASYDFKVAKLVAGWNSNKQSSNLADQRAWFIGGVIPVFGKDFVNIEYTKMNNKLVNNADAKLIAIEYEHPMSKRTTLYGTYAKLNNDGAAALSFGPGVAAGYDPSALQLGLRHAF